MSNHCCILISVSFEDISHIPPFLRAIKDLDDPIGSHGQVLDTILSKGDCLVVVLVLVWAAENGLGHAVIGEDLAETGKAVASNLVNLTVVGRARTVDDIVKWDIGNRQTSFPKGREGLRAATDESLYSPPIALTE